MYKTDMLFFTCWSVPLGALRNEQQKLKPADLICMFGKFLQYIYFTVNNGVSVCEREREREGSFEVFEFPPGWLWQPMQWQEHRRVEVRRFWHTLKSILDQQFLLCAHTSQQTSNAPPEGEGHGAEQMTGRGFSRDASLCYFNKTAALMWLVLGEREATVTLQTTQNLQLIGRKSAI